MKENEKKQILNKDLMLRLLRITKPEDLQNIGVYFRSLLMFTLISIDQFDSKNYEKLFKSLVDEVLLNYPLFREIEKEE